MTDRLLADIDRERSDPDKGLGARILRAARLYAVLKGMGYSGVHIGGHNISCGQVHEIVRQGEALAPGWRELVRHFDYPIDGGFYCYEKDPATGLNREEPRAWRPLSTPPGALYGFARLRTNAF